MRDFWRYYKRFLTHWLKELLSFGREQVVGIILAIFILLFQINAGLIPARDTRATALATVLWPYLALLGVYLVVHLIRTPWFLHEEVEAKANKAEADLAGELEKRGRPEITAEFKSVGAGANVQWMLYLFNSSDSPALDVHIDDIPYGDKVLRFMPPDAMRKNVPYLIRCGILYNGWTETNDVSSLFLTENSVPLQVPLFQLKVHFSSLDDTNREHWVFSATFWYDSQQRRLILSQQTVSSIA